MEVVILAGGRGKRMGDLTNQTPKPLIPICGKPIIHHIINYYRLWGAARFIVCCGYHYQRMFDYIEQIGDRVLAVNKTRVSVSYRDTTIIAVNTGMSTETAGRIKRIKEYLDEDCFHITYGDGLSNININELIACHCSSSNIVTISSVHPESKFGILELDSDMNITAFKEKSSLSGVWINGGFMVANKSVFDYFDGDDCSLEKDCFPILAQRKKLGAYFHHGFWKCMDTDEERLQLERLASESRAPWLV